MAHPHNEHRAHKHERSRVHDIAGVHEEPRHYARGGKVHDDEAEDRNLIRKEVKKSALKAAGGSVKARGDKVPRRARGGHAKGKGHTNVNVIVAPGGGGQRPPMPIAAAPPMPPRPPVAPPPVPMSPGAAGPAPGLGGMPMPPRKRGGRVHKRDEGGELTEQEKSWQNAMGQPRDGKKRGGRVTSDKHDVVRDHKKAGRLEVDKHRAGYGVSAMHGAKRNMGGKVHDDFGAADMDQAHPQSREDDWGDSKMKGYKAGGKVEGKKSAADVRGLTGIGARTPIQHSGNKSDTQNIGRGPVITKATGGPIYADGREGHDMGPNLHAGANSGVGRRAKNALARREHWET